MTFVTSMNNRIGRPVLRGRALAGALALAIVAGLVGPGPVAADVATVHITFGAEVRAGANNVAFSADGQIGFATAYGDPSRGEADQDRVYSFDTATGAIVDAKALTGFHPRQVVYSGRTGYVAVRHDGNAYDEYGYRPEAWIDVMATGTGVRPAEVGSTTTPSGQFALRYHFPIWDPAVVLEGLQDDIPAGDALDDLAFSSDGKLLFYSNCAQMFAHSTGNGLLSPLATINALVDVEAGDRVTFFSYTQSTVLDEATGERVPEVVEVLPQSFVEVGYLSVGVSRNVEIADDPTTAADEYRFVPSARILNFKVWEDQSDASGVARVQFVSTVDLGADGVSEGSNVYIDRACRNGYVVSVNTGTV